MGLANSFARGNLRAKPRSSPVYIRFGRGARGVNADTKKKGKRERKREIFRDGRKGESLSRDQRCGSGVDRCILRRVRVDRLDLLRLCLFMPASFFYFRPSSPLLIPSLSIPLLPGLRLAERAPQMNGITSSVSRGRDARRKF